jgi:hypothetical protein
VLGGLSEGWFWILIVLVLIPARDTRQRSAVWIGLRVQRVALGADRVAPQLPAGGLALIGEVLVL